MYGDGVIAYRALHPELQYVVVFPFQGPLGLAKTQVTCVPQVRGTLCGAGHHGDGQHGGVEPGYASTPRARALGSAAVDVFLLHAGVCEYWSRHVVYCTGSHMADHLHCRASTVAAGGWDAVFLS